MSKSSKWTVTELWFDSMQYMHPLRQLAAALLMMASGVPSETEDQWKRLHIRLKEAADGKQS